MTHVPFAFSNTPLPVPSWLELLFVESRYEKVTITHLNRTRRLRLALNGYPTYDDVALFYATTEAGEIGVFISKELYEVIKPGDTVIIAYKQGRWSGALKGKIAR